MEYLKEKTGKYYRENKFLIIYTILFVLFTYGIKLFFYSMTVDSEVMHVNKDNLSWIALGRFGLTFIKWLTGSIGNFVPYTEVFLGLVCMVLVPLAGLFLIDIAKEEEFGKPSFGKFIFVSIYVSYPSFAELFNFYLGSFEDVFGILLAIIGVSFIILNLREKINTWFYIGGILFLVLSVSIYQSMAVVAFAASMIYFIINAQKEQKPYKTVLKEVFFVLISILIACIIYFVISTILKSFVDIPSHLEGEYLHWGKEAIPVTIRRLLGYASMRLVNKNSAYIQICGYILLVSVIYYLIYTIYKLFKKQYLIALFSFALCVSPFIVGILLGSAMPPRSEIVTPFYIAAAMYFLINNVDKKFGKKVYCILGIGIMLVSIHHANTINKLHYGDFLKYKHDETMVENIADRIGKLNSKEVPLYPVAIIGHYEAPITANTMIFDTLGRSIFSWNSPYRNLALFNILGYPYLYPSEEEFKKAVILSKDLPSWPHEGSVIEKENMIIVKLSDVYPEEYIDKEIFYAPIEFEYSDLPIVEQDTQFYIDIPRMTDNKIVIDKNQEYTSIEGWAIDTNNKSVLGDIVAKVGDEFYSFSPRKRIDLKEYIDAGYYFCVPTDKLLEAKEISFYLVSNDLDYIYKVVTVDVE